MSYGHDAIIPEGVNVHFSVASSISKTSSDSSLLPSVWEGEVDFIASEHFQILTDVNGRKWVKNVSNQTLHMVGNLTYQTTQGGGGAAVLHLWSEVTTDDGLTLDQIPNSLRKSGVANNSDNSNTKGSTYSGWLPNTSVSWAWFSTGGEVVLQSPADTVRGDADLTGRSILWQMWAVES